MIYHDIKSNKLIFTRSGRYQLWLQGTTTEKGKYISTRFLTNNESEHYWVTVHPDNIEYVLKIKDLVLWDHLEKFVDKKRLRVLVNRAKVIYEIKSAHGIRNEFLYRLPKYGILNTESNTVKFTLNIDYWIKWLKSRGYFVKETGKKEVPNDKA